eukprot:4550187-Pleurochrysis_carterae.AAC.1
MGGRSGRKKEGTEVEWWKVTKGIERIQKEGSTKEIIMGRDENRWLEGTHDTEGVKHNLEVSDAGSQKTEADGSTCDIERGAITAKDQWCATTAAFGRHHAWTSELSKGMRRHDEALRDPCKET